jgi:hypothetical protein
MIKQKRKKKEEKLQWEDQTLPKSNEKNGKKWKEKRKLRFTNNELSKNNTKKPCKIEGKK